MFQKMLAYGVPAGVMVGIPLFLFAMNMQGGNIPQWGEIAGYLAMVIALSLIFVAVKRHRDHALGGVIGFLPALGLGLGISVVAGLVYVLAWEAVLAATGIDFAGTYVKTLIAQEQAKGVSGEALQKFIAEMESFKKSYADPLYRMPVTFIEIFPVGVLVSLISAALLQNSRFLPAKRS